ETPPLTNIVQVEAGQSHTCARDGEGQVWCWGDNGWGQLGQVGMRFSPHPLEVAGLGPVVELAAGGDRTCAIEQSGLVKCWGYGPLGDGTEETSAKPVGVRVKADIVDLELGDYHMCGRSSKGDLYCWGSNYMGELGLGNRRDRGLPTKIPGVRNPTSVMTTVYRTCVHNAKGQVQCTGTNVSGQLGDGTRRTKTRLTKVVATSQPSRKLVGGIRYTCSLTQAGTVECWGPVPGVGDVGIRAKPLPDLRPQLTGYLQALAANPGPQTFESCERKAPTRRTLQDPPLATLPTGTTGTLAAGHDHDCYVVDRRTVSCWGRNDHGQVGDGTTSFRPKPHPVVLP
ncbi:MAG: RCC1 domain-containing protein, partial [Nannocystaceae bacterium]